MRNKKILSLIVIIGSIAMLMLIAFLVGEHNGKRQVEKNIIRDTTTFVASDYKAPTPTKEVGIGEISIPLVVYTDKQKVVYVPAESEADTIYKDKDSLHVNIPITQKTYSDSNYVAYVSGFMPQLDSIQVKSKVITHTITQTKTKFRTWNIGITGGYGYGFISHKIEPFMGIGITYNILK